MVKEKTDKIEIEKSKLDEILKRMERLEKAASKARLHNVDEKNKEKKGKVVKLRMIDGKVITGWSNMVRDIVEKTPAGVWKEDQQVELWLEDGTKEVMPYVVFARRYSYLPADVISETKDDEGTTFNVETYDGKKYSVRDTFIN